ncbi:hypothetical protein BH10PAT1_BH10PAT1_0080 [soil metagenome]
MSVENLQDLLPLERAKVMFLEKYPDSEEVFKNAENGIRDFLTLGNKSYLDDLDKLKPKVQEYLEVERFELGGVSILATIRSEVDKELKEEARKKELET